RRSVAGAGPDLSGLGGVDALQRRGEAVGVAFAANFPVADDIDAGALHIADGKQGGIVLRLFEPRLGHAPDRHAHARYRFRQQLTVHQPIRLGIAADNGGGQQLRWAHHGCSLTVAMARKAACGIEDLEFRRRPAPAGWWRRAAGSTAAGARPTATPPCGSRARVPAYRRQSTTPGSPECRRRHAGCREWFG